MGVGLHILPTILQEWELLPHFTWEAAEAQGN